MPADAPDQLDPEAEKALAIDLYNAVWTMLRKPQRSVDERDALVHCAHASAWHWSRVGTAQNRAIGEWQISRVYAELGRGEPAVHHARRALDLAQTVEGSPWLTASAFEGLSRAHSAAGEHAAARDWREKAVAALESIEDPEDREVVARDIASLPA